MQPGTKYTHTFTVDAGVYEGFINIFRDRNPLHTNEAFAMQIGFAGRVMHGNILNGFVSFFIGECLPTKDVIIHAQTIKYAYPVYLDDELSFVAELTDFFESVKTYDFKFYFQNKAGKKVAKGTVQIGLLS